MGRAANMLCMCTVGVIKMERTVICIYSIYLTLEQDKKKGGCSDVNTVLRL